MNDVKIKNKGQAVLFKNKYLELLTKSNPLVIWIMYLLIIVGMIYYSIAIVNLSLLKVMVLFLSGSFIWTLAEYLIHRFLFHIITENKTGKKLVYLFHGNHHEFPRDKQRLFMPLVPSVLIASLFFGSMYLTAFLFNIPNFSFSFFAGFLFSYLIYVSMHYAIHAVRPPFKWMNPLWKNHHLHHYKHEEKGFDTMYPQNYSDKK
jgi:sterol desaturase/sphingolipid hydroxylase (fatty acid hydroxylase superfamily)